MADYSEWLETTLGTDAFEDDIDQGALQQMALQQRQELDAVLCLVDCQLDMFQPIEIKENKNMNNCPLGVTNISITKETLGDSTLFSNVAEDVSVSATTRTAEASSSSSVKAVKKSSDSSLKGSCTCTPFQNALRCVLKLYQDKIITSCKDVVGLALYNTRVKHNIYDIPGVYLFHPFEFLGIHCLQEMEELVAAGEVDSLAYERFEKKVGHSQEGETQLSDVLWASMHMFMRLRSEMIKYRRVFLFTNDDEPHRGDDLEKNRCLARVRDLHEIGVSLEVFAIGKNTDMHVSGGDLSLEEDSLWGKEKTNTTERYAKVLFRGEKFWDHLLHAATNTSVMNNDGNDNDNNDTNNDQKQQHLYQEPYVDVVHIGSGPQAFDNLLSAVRRRTHPQHPYQRTVLTIGVSVNGSSVPTMAVSVYYPVMPVQTQRMEWLDSRTKKIVKRQTQHVVKTSSLSSLLSEADKENDDNNKKTDEVSIVNPENLLQSIVLGGRRLFVFPQEKERVIATTTNNVTVGFSILCFKHTEDILKHKHSLQKSSFLHPNLNDGGEGSLRLFVQLTRTLLQQNKVAVAQYLASRTAAPRLVALVPSPPSFSFSSYSYSHPSMGLSSILTSSGISSSSSTPVEGLGLYVVPLPYAEDIRKVPTLPCFSDNTTPKPEELALATRILSSLSVSYDIHAVPNPLLQHRLQLMQKMAMQQTTLDKGNNNTNELETVKDLSLPDREGMRHYAHLFQEFNNTVLGPSYDADKLCQSYKPKVVAGVKTHRTGESTDDSANDAIVRLVKKAFENNALQTLTVLQLRSYLNAVGESTDGARRKDDLIQVVTRVMSGQK
ncbi:Ku70/Ku80 [Trypanosoma melophagium]|uniref:Ku70/Ku80 n=1 Tax=Trypanosoma melophagium TaxID=715481 RepID=UPI00351A3AF2|nr:Ku70/Ku80 [Trypanosoma melophagium]